MAKRRNLINVTNILFTDRSGVTNETQFDTHNEHELAELWWEFCLENDLISLVQGTADWETGVMYDEEYD